MTLFSQRKGITPLKKEFQREAIDDELKNRLWSALKIVVWDKCEYSKDLDSVSSLVDVLWLNYFKLPLDTCQGFNSTHARQSTYMFLREYFFRIEWYEVFDFIEFVIKHIPKVWADSLRDFCNNFLEDENCQKA